jgi:hypothetical protein
MAILRPHPTNATSRGRSVSTSPSTAIRWERLSVQSTAILRQVVWPIHAEGYSATEIAKRIGISPFAVRLLSDFFANEVSDLGRPDVKL